MSPLLQVKDLTKSYGKLIALHQVSFDVAQGEIVGLIGPNGAGKTTLIGILSGAIKPSAGRITYGGRLILGLKPYRLGELGIVRTFQLVQPFLHLTACECVMLGNLFGAADGRSASIEAARERARALLATVGLGHKTNAEAGLLNIPERKKLEIARAIAARPKLLLLDEVMAGLSSSEIAEIIALLHKLRAEGVSIIVIEHVMQAIRGLADRMIVLHHGEKIAEGSTADVLRQDNVVKHYTGATP
jgi:branched-chain amino acid transport system ATP-binding protein